MKKFAAAVLVTISAVALAPSAQALPIKSSISFAGFATPVPALTVWAGAQGVDFGSATVADGIGIFDGLEGLAAPHTDFLFDPLTPSPVTPLFTAGAYSFTLTSVKVILQTSTFLILSGRGLISGPGIVGEKPAAWAFSSQQVGGGFSFSSSAELPEPAMLSLLALGLLGSARLTSRIRRG
jgi:hypothetical protein